MGLSAAGHDILLLTGGTGGAKLARGIADAFGPERLTAIVNTGDDIEIYGAHVSPDPDLVCFWLAGLIDERGWGMDGDSFAVMDGLRELGVDVWFNLGDRDLAWCLERARMLAEGLSPAAAIARLGEAIGLRARVLPMSDRAGPDLGAHARHGMVRLSGVHDPRPCRGAGRGPRVPGRRGGQPGRGRARGDRGAPR